MQGICAGKHSVADYLIHQHGFRSITLGTEIIASTRASTLKSIPSEHDDLGDGEAQLKFSDFDALLNHVTKHWNERWVTTDIWDETTLDVLLRRPFFILISVDAPVGLRWRRLQDKHAGNPATAFSGTQSLEDFVIQSDHHLYNPTIGLTRMIDRAQLRLLNSSSSMNQLHRSLDTLNLTSEERLRPNWDQYFMRLASLAAMRSNCMKRRVGCVIVREKRVISTGYNGTPRNIRNCNEGGCMFPFALTSE